jgi:diguanylate cyclase (GGDEF)-like protein
MNRSGGESTKGTSPRGLTPHLVEELDFEIKRSERTKREFALLLFDLDGLKEVNDRYGHLTGSQALCRLADVLCISCRDIDTAARFGGDEFALVLPETGGESANLVAHRICESLANDGRKPKLSASVGVAIYPMDGEKLDTLLGAADVALCSMKARIHSHARSAQTGGR